MKFKAALFALLSVIVSGVSASSSLAAVTHKGKIEIDLQLVDARGSMSKIDSETASLQVDWTTGACQVQVANLSLNCKFDRTQDLNAPGGALLVHEMPVIHFDVQSLDAVLKVLGQGDRRTKDIINQVVVDSSSSRSSGFDLPTYTCEKCVAGSNGKIPVWNAYESFVLRSLDVNSSALQGKKLALRMKLSKMSANAAAFNIIGNNDAGNFGAH